MTAPTLHLTPEQAEKINRAMAGDKVDLTGDEAEMLNQAMGHAPAKPPEAQPVPDEPEAFSPRSVSGTALRSFGKGASFGFSDELAGLQGAGDEVSSRLWRGLGVEVSGLQDASVSPEMPFREALVARYRHERDGARRDLAEGAAVNPKTALVSELAGAAAAPIKGVGSLRGLSVAQKVGRFGAQGLAMGAASGLGGSSADLTEGDVGGAARDTAAGGAVGFGVGATLGPVAARAGEIVTEGMVRRAEDNVLKAINNPGISDKFAKLGIVGEDARREFARKALNSGLIRFGDDAAAIEARADEFTGRWGTIIGDVTDKADAMNTAMMEAAAARNAEKVSAHIPRAAKYDEAVGNGMDAWRKRDADVFADSLDDSVRPWAPDPPVPLLPAKPPQPALEPVRSAVDNKAIGAAIRARLGQRTNVERMGDGPALDLASRIESEPRQTFDALRRSKSSAQGAVNWSEQAPQSKEIFRDATGEVRNQFLKQIEPVIGPDELDTLRLANEQFGHASDVATLAGDKASREAGKSAVGLREAGFGAAVAGGLGGGPVGAAGGAAAAHTLGAVGRRLPATAAALSEGSRRFFSGAPQNAVKGLEADRVKAVLKTPKDQADEEAVSAFVDGFF